MLINSIDAAHGGTSRSSTSVVSELTRQYPQIEITLITRFSKNPVLTDFKSVNAKVVFCKGIVHAIFQNLGLLRQVDVIHVQGLWSTFPILLAIITKLTSGARTIVSPRGMLESWSLKQGALKKKLALFTYQGLLFRMTDIFHVTSSEESKSLSAIVPANKNVVIPNGIDISSFREADHLYNSESRTILFLSRIHPKKGLEILFDAWSILATKWPKWRVRIIGDGDKAYIVSLKKLISEKNLSNIEVERPLYGKDKIEAYATSDLFVLPTYSENFGIVIAEALASGLPVITTKGTPWSEIQALNCGEYIELNVGDLLNAMEKWMELMPESRKTLGLQGKRLIQTKYSLDSVVSSFEKLYSNNQS